MDYKVSERTRITLARLGHYNMNEVVSEAPIIYMRNGSPDPYAAIVVMGENKDEIEILDNNQYQQYMIDEKKRVEKERERKRWFRLVYYD